MKKNDIYVIFIKKKGSRYVPNCILRNHNPY